MNIKKRFIEPSYRANIHEMNDFTEGISLVL